jgi:hypothetical protein
LLHSGARAQILTVLGYQRSGLKAATAGISSAKFGIIANVGRDFEQLEEGQDMSGKTLKALLIAWALGLAGAAQAQFTIYTDQAAFVAAVCSAATDTFNDLQLTLIDSPLSRAATIAPYSYTANAANVNPQLDPAFFAVGTPGDAWLSTNNGTDEITLTGIPANVRGIGGYFFGTDRSGAAKTGKVVVQAHGAGFTASQEVIDATTTSFVGFVFNGPFASPAIRMSASQVPPPLYPTINNLIFGIAGASTCPTPALTKAASRKVHGAAGPFDLTLKP